MGRRPRIHYPGAVYHAMARGVDGRDIFVDEQDRLAFLRILERVALQTNSVVYAYCLMGNHFHLAIKVGTVPLPLILQRILTGYATTFNGRHDRTGHLFQARYKSVLCQDNSYLVALIRYIHMNPVRAGLTDRPGDWPWSSYNEYQVRNQNGLLAAESDMPDFDPWKTDASNSPTALLRSNIDKEMTLAEISAAVSEQTGISVAELCSGSRCRIVVDAKRILVHSAIGHGYRLSVVAHWLGTSRGTITHYLRENNRHNYRPDTKN